MWPCCREPSNSPAPRISRSAAASRKPAPSSLNSCTARNRWRATAGEVVAAGHDEVGIGVLVAAPDPAAQLVELGQAEAVGAVDDDRVRPRDVQAVLHDGGGDQHVGLVVGELHHHLLEPALGQLAVGGDDPRLGDHLPDRPGQRRQRLDAVVHHEDLPAAAKFLAHGLRQDVLAEGNHVGLDRHAARRRRLDDRQIANAGQGHLQRAGNRRGGHREHVDADGHLLQALLVPHAEALLLVDDQQAQLA